MYVDLIIEMWSCGRVGDARIAPSGIGGHYLPEERHIVPYYMCIPATHGKAASFIAAVREKPGHVQLSDWYEVR